MNSAQKEVLQTQINDEKKTIKQLQKVYEQARKDCEQKIRELSSRKDLENIQTIVYQKQYQEALKKQLDGILDNLQSEEFVSVADYLQKSYQNGYIGVMYDLQKQGIPIIAPIRQDQVVKALQTDSKLSKDLYSKMGEDVSYLKRSIRAELSRGIANGSTWNEMAEHIANGMNSPFKRAYNNAIRISRTEGHRIQQRSALDAQYAAKEKGADIVKQWDSTLDGKTRPHHRQLDGQIRELDEPFEVDGMKADAPGHFGKAKEDCNCRCCLLQRARWALDDGFTKMDNFTGNLREFQNPKDYEEFKKWYFSKENIQYMNYVDTLEKRYKTKDFNKLLSKMSDSEYNYFSKLESASPMWKEHEKITKNIRYSVSSKTLESRNFIGRFDKMTDDSLLRREYISNAKEMLKHRSGQNGEDLYLYNMRTKKWIKSTTGTEAGTPEYTEEIKNAIIEANKGELVAFHNHPASMPPSANDINAARHNGYAIGYILCHDGKIYEYTASKVDINISAYNLRIADFQEKGYTEFESQLETMKYLSEMYGFEFKEVK